MDGGMDGSVGRCLGQACFSGSFQAKVKVRREKVVAGKRCGGAGVRALFLLEGCLMEEGSSQISCCCLPVLFCCIFLSMLEGARTAHTPHTHAAAMVDASREWCVQ